MTDLLGPGAFGAARATAVRPTLSPGNGAGDPDTWAQDCTSPTANDGTENRAGLFNMFLAQLRHLIRKSGIAADNTNDDMLAAAVRSQHLNYAAAVGGTANALTVTLDPPLTAHQPGLMLRIKAAVANEPAATLDAGPGALPIKRMDGAVVARGDIPASIPATLICTGTAWVIGGLAYSEVYRPVFGTITVYVRTDGNDANDGSANTAAKAKKTIKAAIDDTLRNVILNGQKLIVQLGIAGSYTGAPVSGSGVNVTIIGDTGAPASYVITEALGTQYCALGSENGSVIYQGVRFSSTYPSAALPIWASRGGRVRLETCRIDRLVSDASSSLFYAASGGSISIGGTLDLVGAEGAGTTLETCVKTELGGIFEGASFAVPATWRPYNLNCGSGFALAGISSSQNWLATTMSPIGSGNFGKRYAAVGCGVINTAGAGASYFPGATAGTTASGGQYV